MKIEIEKTPDGNAVIASIVSENLDASNAEAFKAQIQPLLEANSNVIIDMGRLNFVDSSGLGALLSTLRAMNNKNGQLKLFAMAKPVQALFELVRMQRIFAIYNTRDEAIAAL